MHRPQRSLVAMAMAIRAELSRRQQAQTSCVLSTRRSIKAACPHQPADPPRRTAGMATGCRPVSTRAVPSSGATAAANRRLVRRDRRSADFLAAQAAARRPGVCSRPRSASSRIRRRELRLGPHRAVCHDRADPLGRDRPGAVRHPPQLGFPQRLAQALPHRGPGPKSGRRRRAT